MNFRYIATLCLLCLLTACNVGPKYKKPETTVDKKFSGQKQGGYASDAAVAEWWNKFHDSQLNNLIQRALAGNKDLQIAAARVQEAKALRNSVRLDYFPTVTSAASYNNQQRSLAQTGSLALGPRSSEIYSAGFEAAWELDIWGRVRKLNKAAKADVATAEALRHDTMVILTAQVASSYLELRGLQNQLAVAQRNVTNQRETLKIEDDKFKAGTTSALPSLRASAQLNTTLAAMPLIEGTISKDIHRISVLIGEQPATLERELKKAQPMPTLPSLVHIGKPAELLRRRPDIEAAEKSLEAATERVGVAVADLFPKVTFNGTVAIQANSLGGTGSGARSFGPNISWAAFNLGRVQAQIDAAGARAKAQLASYQKTVLLALEETEDALVDYGRQQARRELLRQAAKDAEAAAKIAHEGVGALDPLNITEADRAMLLAQIELASSETNTATALVSIYKALGGGWEGR